MNKRLTAAEVSDLFEAGKVLDPWTHEVVDAKCEKCGHEKFKFRGFDKDGDVVYECLNCTWMTTFTRGDSSPPPVDGSFRRRFI